MKLYGFQCHFHEVGGHSPPYGALKTTWRNVGWAAPTMIATGLEKIIRSKKTLGRPRDLAVIEILERTLDEKKRKDRSNQLKALKKESERNLIEQIRRQLALPMNRSTNFLRKRLPGGGSCL